MTPDAPHAIEATGLVKAFGETRAVDGVDLVVPSGSVYGVLGPNGAGKTTTIRMLATLLRPDAGPARVPGHHTAEAHPDARGPSAPTSSRRTRRSAAWSASPGSSPPSTRTSPAART